MTQVTQLITKAEVTQLEKNIGSKIGVGSKGIEEMKIIGKKLKENGKMMDELKKKGKEKEFRALNKDFMQLVGKVGIKMEEMEYKEVMVRLDMDLEQTAKEVVELVNMELKVNEEVIMKVQRKSKENGGKVKEIKNLKQEVREEETEKLEEESKSMSN